MKLKNTVNLKWILSCDPFEYTEDVNLKLTKPGVIYNPGTIESDPKFWIVGNGTFRITINDVSFQIKDVNGSVVIDSEILKHIPIPYQ